MNKMNDVNEMKKTHERDAVIESTLSERLFNHPLPTSTLQPPPAPDGFPISCTYKEVAWKQRILFYGVCIIKFMLINCMGLTRPTHKFV